MRHTIIFYKLTLTVKWASINVHRLKTSGGTVKKKDQ